MPIRLESSAKSGYVNHIVKQGADTTFGDVMNWGDTGPDQNITCTLSVNASGFGASGTASPFLNICKSMTPLAFGISGTKIEYPEIVAGGYTDAIGYVTARPPEATSGLWALWSWQGPGFEPLAGRYRFTYTGDQITGTLGISVVSNTPGELIFNIGETPGQFGWFWATITPSNYPQNFVCVREDYQDLYDAGEIFNPEYIASLRGLSQLRHLNTLGINGSEMDSINDFPIEDNPFWSPIPLSVIMKLHNKTKIDPWICMPHRAMQIAGPGIVDTTFARDLCGYLKANLDPSLIAYIQNSNETWNSTFDQFAEVFNEARDRGWSDVNNSVSYWAMADVVLAQACKEEYGAEAATRLHYSAGSQAASAGVTSQFATASVWQSEEPDNWIDPATVLDSICVASYFGSGFISAPNEIANLKARVDAGDTEQELITYIDGRIGALDYIGQAIGWLQASKTAAGSIPLILYEGGTHIQHWFAVQGVSEADYEACIPALTAYSYSPELAARYATLMDAWALIGDGQHMDYNHIGQPGKFGAFGMARSLNDFDNPRASYQIARSVTETPWWDDPRRGVQCRYWRSGLEHLRNLFERRSKLFLTKPFAAIISVIHCRNPCRATSATNNNHNCKPVAPFTPRTVILIQRLRIDSEARDEQRNRTAGGCAADCALNN
ncbi:hypothetical protein ROLI_019990 [Roseobacter fucihabitans]|uniref:Uncharacterized protein n=1 Tax=Roseobacter fucihabitans TaxID=1537242 RepID=A0ABZ2BSC5_9RHOB|nr:hypothetical protein [Roseobacter litoralis]MBC6966213.1 hypothetical protein [Roseobacter litoralis]